MLIIKKAIILTKYLDFANMFLKKKTAMKLSKCFDINENLIDLKLNKQLFYNLTYILEQVILTILKIYIETNLDNSFICFFKFLAKVPILFV